MRCFPAIGFVFILVLSARADDPAVLTGDHFTTVVQPILAEHCLQCHGPDAGQREAELRLDVETSAKEIAIVAGDAENSELYRRITSSDPDLRMPPGDGSRLSDQEVDALRAWIQAGAPYQQHWAFRKIQAVTPPRVEAELTSIDQFIVEQLRQQQLSLSPPATKQQLIRRATFDLTGLPPTWSDVENFLQDDSPQAFARVVDRLLESPAYGERWGRHWLDIARYADTHGGGAVGFTRFPFSYTYRDYVIAAFNADVPYDRFIIEQLAADQLGLSENASQLAALGFLSVGMQFRNRNDLVDDQIDVVARGLLGLTVACARCHDHKFDDITTKDYYSLYATLASSRPPEELPLIGEPSPTEKLESYEKELTRLKVDYADAAREQSEVMRGRLRMQVGLYLREIAKGAPEQDLSTTNIFSYRTDDLRPHVLENWRRYLQQMSPDDAVFGPWVRLAAVESSGFADSFREQLATWQQENGEPVKELQRLTTVAPKWNPRVLKALVDAQPTSLQEVAAAYGTLFASVHTEWLTGLLETSEEGRPDVVPVPDEDARHAAINSAVNRQLRRHLYGPNTPTNMEDPVASRLLNRPINDNVNGRRRAIHNLNLSDPGSPPRAMVLLEQVDAPPQHVFRRGNPIDRGEPVVPRFLSALGGSDTVSYPDGKRRWSLAKSIVDPDNPLTRRVIVNWVWQRHFGRGLVRTPDDFGTRGRPPKHPRLLDYLATKLLEDQWSLKQLHRRIMLSAVYQQASLERHEARVVDPDNELFWRMPRRRLELEAMRDGMLAVSGELKADGGGRPFELLAQPIVPRRSVYAFVNRDFVAPFLSTFDVADPNACTAQRPETTVPQQTLFALNSDFIQDRASALVAAVWPSSSVDEAAEEGRIVSLYRRVFSRDPDQQELATALDYVRLTDGTSEEEITRRWQQLVHVLLAANEFVFVD